MDHSKAIYLSDMSRCGPAAALSPRHTRYHWQTVPYQADGVSGTLLFAGPETEAPPVTLPVDATGWHAIFVGLWSNWTESLLKVKLTDDRAFVMMDREEASETSNDPVHSGPSAGRVNNYALDERFWKYADVTGRDIVFAQHSAGTPAAAYVAYVKLVPLAGAEVAAIQADRADQGNKRLFFMHDGFGVFQDRQTTREELWDRLEPMRDTDFSTLLWCIGVGGDVLNYPSPHGTMTGAGLTDFPREADRDITESLEILSGKGVNTLREVIDYCHSMGVKVHAGNRMEAFQCSAPFDEFFTGNLYRDHPEWRCVDIDGREIARMSYAHDGVGALMLSLFREVADEYGADGVHPMFNRGAPFLLYEQPLVDGFKRETGLDPRDLDERDERYLRFRARVMTEFMRTLRRQMDAIGEGRGRKVEITAHVLSDEETNLFYALDVPTWVREGLIDNLVSYPWRDAEIDVEYFGALTRGTAVRYYPEVMPRRMSPEEYRQRAVSYYASGADGLCFWDTYNRDRYRKEFSMVRRLGHRADLAAWDDGEGEFYRSVKLLSVGGYVLDKYPPHWAY